MYSLQSWVRARILTLSFECAWEGEDPAQALHTLYFVLTTKFSWSRLELLDSARSFLVESSRVKVWSRSSAASLTHLQRQFDASPRNLVKEYNWESPRESKWKKRRWFMIWRNAEGPYPISHFRSSFFFLFLPLTLQTATWIDRINNHYRSLLLRCRLN